ASIGRTLDEGDRDEVGPVLLASARATIDGIARNSAVPGAGSSSLTSLTGAPLVSAAWEMISSMDVVGFAAAGVSAAADGGSCGAGSVGLLSATGSDACSEGTVATSAAGAASGVVSAADMGSAGAAVGR